MYGLDRLIKSVELYAPQYGSDGIVNYVARDYSRFVQDHVQDDDVTLIVVKYVGLGNEAKAETSLITTSWIDQGEKSQVMTPEDESPIV
jgi:methionine salvage enolase-phosphatase E1